MLVFQLVDVTRRTFQTQRYCFLGSVDDWIAIGKPGKLTALVKIELDRDSAELEKLLRLVESLKGRHEFEPGGDPL